MGLQYEWGGVVDYRFILGKTTPAAHRKTIAGLSQVLGVSENLAGKLVKGAPISLFAELTLVQAQALLNVFAPLAEAGALFSVEAGDNSLSSYGYVGWPRTPTIHGKPLEELTLDVKARPLPQDDDIQVTPAKPLPPAKSRPKPAQKSDTRSLPPKQAQPETRLQKKAPPKEALPPVEPVEPAEEEDPLFDMGDLGPAIDTTSVPIISNNDLVDYETNQYKAVSADNPEKVSPTSPTGSFNVVVPKTGKPGAAELIAKFLDVSPDEAAGLLKKPLVFVAKGVEKSRAMEVAKAFKLKGIATRITRAKT